MFIDMILYKNDILITGGASPSPTGRNSIRRADRSINKNLSLCFRKKVKRVARIYENGKATVYYKSFMPYNLYLELEDDMDTRVQNLTNFYFWCSSRLLTLDRKYAKVFQCSGNTKKYFFIRYFFDIFDYFIHLKKILAILWNIGTSSEQENIYRCMMNSSTIHLV